MPRRPAPVIDPEFAGQTTVEVLAAFARVRRKLAPFARPYVAGQHPRSFGGCDPRVVEIAKRLTMPALRRSVRAS